MNLFMSSALNSLSVAWQTPAKSLNLSLGGHNKDATNQLFTEYKRGKIL